MYRASFSLSWKLLSEFYTLSITFALTTNVFDIVRLHYTEQEGKLKCI